jgi:hypothetical protein
MVVADCEVGADRCLMAIGEGVLVTADILRTSHQFLRPLPDEGCSWRLLISLMSGKVRPLL